jgi:hypothetical protein
LAWTNHRFDRVRPAAVGKGIRPADHHVTAALSLTYCLRFGQFSASQDALSKLAAEARADRAAGHTTDLDPEKL